MQFSFTSDQQLLSEGVRDFLAGECTSEDVAAAWTDGPRPERWKALASLGLVGLLAPAEHGGLGMHEVDLCLPLEHTGWAGLPEPLFEVAAVVVPLLSSLDTPAAHGLLEAISAGDLLVVPALDADPYPAHVGTADRVLLQRGNELHVADRTSLQITPQPNLDGARPTAVVDASTSETTLLSENAGAALGLAASRGAWASAAVLLGAARRCLDLATAYSLEREQFGKPIGSFQAVKHHLASALVEVEFARPLVHRAAWSLANGDPRAGLHASMAKAVAGESAAMAAKAALQVHGAIGYTWEHPLHLWMKRIWSLRASWGTTEEHWQHVEAATVPAGGGS